MSSQTIISIKHDIRKTIFNAVKRNPRLLDATCVSIALAFNMALVYALGIHKSELLPAYFLSIFFIFTFTGRRINPDKVAKDLLREHDVIAFVMGGDQVRIGFINSFLQTADSDRIGLSPDRDYVTIADKNGEIRVLPVSNIGMIQ